MKKSQLQTKFHSPDESPGLLLWQVNNMWQRRQRKALAAHGLTHVQFVLLASLVWATSSEPMTQKQLAAQAKADVMMTSQVLRALEQKGLISRTASITDGRSFTLAPTKAGTELANAAVKTVEDVDRRFFAPLNMDTRKFVKLMRRIADC